MSINILNSFKWSAIGEITSKVLPPLFYIITARLLTPDDFGIVATWFRYLCLLKIHGYFLDYYVKQFLSL